MLNKRRKLFNSSRVKQPFDKMSCLRVVFWCQHIWFGFFLVQVDAVKQSIQRNSVGSGHVSHCRNSAFYVHLEHCFVVFKMYNYVFSKWESFVLVTTWSTFDNSSTSRLPLLFNFVLGLVLRISPRDWFLNAWCAGGCGCSLKNVILLSPHPTDREQDYHPFANKHPER